MKVILIADIKKVGQKGQVVEVADGYAQNVLLPRKLALPGTAANLAAQAAQDERVADKKALSHTLLAKALKTLHGKTLTLEAKANDTGTLFQAIHEKEIVRAVKSQYALDLPDSVVVLPEPLKKAGTHTVQLEGEGEQASLTLVVA